MKLQIERSNHPDDAYSRNKTTIFKVDDVSMGQCHAAIVVHDAESAGGTDHLASGSHGEKQQV